MESINRHIVSRLKWDTTFDQKSEAYTIQERLSTWSKFTMPKEIMAIFNELCPSEQSWRIQSLEIDLGICDYNDLEFDLSTKLRRELNDKLSELIINQSSQNKIEVCNKEKTILENLTVFLVEGYLPWNYQNKDGSINQLMAELLQNNLAEIIATIKKNGITYEQVRKRIAYQFNETNITRIIKALEPNNSTPIIEFATVMTKLQTKETIVQTSTASFIKNIWFWILNYLLVERGTLFNKLAFMKSTIQQMANHYNIAYSELILLIENTIVKISEKTKQHNDFISSLKILTSEYETNINSNHHIVPTIDYWFLLEELLKNSSNRRSSTQKTNLNELILKLNNENSSKFKEIIIRVFETDKNCISLIRDINEVSIRTIFSKLDTTQNSLNFESITYLYKLCKILNLKINENKLWEIGIEYLLKNRTISNEGFLHFCINEISKRNLFEPKQLFELLTNVKIPTSLKSSKTLEIYCNISTLYSKELEIQSPNFISNHLKKILEKLEKQFSATKNKNEVFIKLQESFSKNIALHPKIAFEVLLSYSNKEFLKKILPFILNRQLLQLLVNKGNNEKTKLLQTIQEVYEINKKNEKYVLDEDLIQEDLLSIGLYEIFINTKHDPNYFLENILKQLSKKVTNTKLKDFNYFIIKLIESKRIKSLGISLKDTLFDQKQIANPVNVIELGQFIQNNSQDAQVELALLLETHFNEPNFIVLRKQNNRESEKFINYFLKNGTSFKNNWIKTKSKIIQKITNSMSISAIEDDLQELFWNTLLNYTAYKGNEILFQNLLEATLKLHLPIFNKKSSKQNEETNQVSDYVEINSNFNPIIISPETIEILNKINSNSILNSDICNISSIEIDHSSKEIEDWLKSIICQNQIPETLRNLGFDDRPELLNQIIIKNPKAFLRIIKNEIIPESQMDWLYRIVNFKTLCSSIGKLDRNKEPYLSILEKFYKALGSISFNKINSQEIQRLLFRKTIKAIANNNWKIISTQNIWNELIWEIGTQKGVSKKILLMDIEKHINCFPLSLQLSLKAVINNERQTIKDMQRKETISKTKELKSLKKQIIPIKESIAIRNAGIVILNSYIVMLFERLNLVHNNQFTSIENQINSIHYLQYVITGLSKTEESYLPLNKVLCGVSLSQAVPDEIDISEENRLLIEGLIKASITHWNVIGECSVDGFRGNWLVRDGLLLELEDKWELTVEKRAYDILISKSPFAFSIIKYPWMNKPLHVIWPY